MTREAALYDFFSRYNMPAYPSTAVPDKATFPYMTYETTSGNWGDSVSISINLWFHTESESVPNAKVKQISDAIGMGGLVLPYDQGKMWIKKGSPWCTSFSDETDNTFKRRQLILLLEDWRV